MNTLESIILNSLKRELVGRHKVVFTVNETEEQEATKYNTVAVRKHSDEVVAENITDVDLTGRGKYVTIKANRILYKPQGYRTAVETNNYTFLISVKYEVLG